MGQSFHVPSASWCLLASVVSTRVTPVFCLSLYTIFPLCVCAHISCLTEDSRHTGLRSTLRISFELIVFTKTLSLNKVSFKGLGNCSFTHISG